MATDLGGPVGAFAIAFVLLVTQAASSSQLNEDRRVKRAGDEKPAVVTTITGEPYLSLRSSDEPLSGNDRYEGYIADLMEKVAEHMGIDYELREVADGMYGSLRADGTWAGMVGELTRGEADIAAGPLTITSPRERVVDFSKPFMAVGPTILMKKPENVLTTHYDSILIPFSSEVWIVLCISYVVVSLLFFLLSRFLVRGRDPRSEETLRQVRSKQIGPQLADGFWWTTKSFLCQGWSGERWPTSIAMRVLSVSWFAFSLLTLILYVLSLNAFLGVAPPSLPFSSADGMARQTEVKYGVVNSGSTASFFSTSQIPLYVRMWSSMVNSQPSVFVLTYTEGVQRVRRERGKYAFIMESTTASYMEQRKPCDLVQVGGLLNQNAYGFATPLGSELRDRLALAMLELRENGFLQKLEKKWWYDKGECGKMSKYESSGDQGGSRVMSAMRLKDFAGPFFILGVGVVLAILVAVMELIVSKCRKETDPLNNVEDQQLKTSDPATF